MPHRRDGVCYHEDYGAPPGYKKCETNVCVFYQQHESNFIGIDLLLGVLYSHIYQFRIQTYG